MSPSRLAKGERQARHFAETSRRPPSNLRRSGNGTIMRKAFALEYSARRPSTPLRGERDAFRFEITWEAGTSNDEIRCRLTINSIAKQICLL
jgi:hypothetical protein